MMQLVTGHLMDDPVDGERPVLRMRERRGAIRCRQGPEERCVHPRHHDDHFRFDATNFIPSWQNKKGKGFSFDKWVPRATVSGPIKPGKTWFFDSADAEYDNYVFKD